MIAATWRHCRSRSGAPGSRAGTDRAAGRARSGAAARPLTRRIENPLAFDRYRWRIAREILLARRPRTRAPVPRRASNNPPSRSKPGRTSLTIRPLKAGPQADGFPVRPLSHAVVLQAGRKSPRGFERDRRSRSFRPLLAEVGFQQSADAESVYDGRRCLIVNVQVPQDTARLRGKRVKVGYWFAWKAAAHVPGMTSAPVRQERVPRGFLATRVAWTTPPSGTTLKPKAACAPISRHGHSHRCPVPDDPKWPRSPFSTSTTSRCKPSRSRRWRSRLLSTNTIPVKASRG